MEPYPFTDRAGRDWHVYDYRIVDRRKRVVPIGHWSAEARAFVPANGEGPILVDAFGPVAYHDSPPRASCLENELRFAKPRARCRSLRSPGSE